MVTLAPISGVIKIIGRGRSQRSLHSHTMARLIHSYTVELANEKPNIL